MKSGLALSSVVVGACGFSGPKVGEVPADGPGGSPDGCTTFSAQLDTCKLPNPIPLTLAGIYTFDTDSGVLKDSNNVETPVSSTPVMTLGAEVRALVATTVVLMPNTSLRAVGVRGFAIVASGAITMMANASIDVSQGGAGYRGDCGALAAANGVADTGGGSGGGGGGFGAAGGNGGMGDMDEVPSLGGRGGMAAAAAPEGPLGGCSGAKGGKDADANNEGGAGGLGGGAVYVVSAVSIGIADGAGINASGAGGRGGERNGGSGDAGGGGGGSGGSIFLEAPLIRSEGILAANGGGGGEGSGGNVAGQLGEPGPFGVTQAAGGVNNTSGTGAAGGAGGYLMSPAGVTPTQFLSGGGGGGGGSVGFIRVRSGDAQLGANSSPAPQ